MKTCKQCKNKFYDKKHPNKIFCSRKCFFESIKRIMVCVKYKCKFCGKIFEKTKTSKESMKSYKFCSCSCNSKARADPDKKKLFTCKQCGKSFIDWVCRNKRFCSHHCKSVYGAHHTNKRRNPDLYVIKPCVFCKKPHEFYVGQIRLRGAKYCSRDCVNKAMSIAKRGRGNPNYTGGVKGSYYRGPNWHSQSRKARRRDKYTCQNCGEKWEKSKNKRTDVHHITPYRKFKKSEWLKANDLNNLIVLCRKCHRKVECGKIPCPKVKF